MAVRELITKRIQERRVALGNTRKGLKEVASDLLNEDIGKNKKRIKVVAQGCYLSPATVARVMDCEEFYRPAADTLERILRFYNVTLGVEFSEAIKAAYQNKPKVDRRHD